MARMHVLWGFNSSCYNCLVILSPEDAYKEMILRKKNTMNTLTNCKISAFDAKQGINGRKDAWSCPDGTTRYLPVKYRPEGSLSENKVQ